MKPFITFLFIVILLSVTGISSEPVVEPNQVVNGTNSPESTIQETDSKVLIRQLNRKITDLEKQVNLLQVQVRNNENSIQDLTRQVKLLQSNPPRYSTTTTTSSAPRQHSLRNTLPDDSQK